MNPNDVHALGGPAGPPGERRVSEEDSAELQDLQPEQVLKNFSKFPIILFFVVSLSLHVVVIGGTSTRFIWDKYVDPTGAKLREEAKKKAKEDAERAVLEAEKKAKEAERKSKDAAKPGDPAKPGEAKPGDPAKPGEAKPVDPSDPEGLKQKAIDKLNNDKAKPEDIPKAPADNLLKDIDNLK
ncbi:hypothetical protein LBMAG53_10380 [Planctomycetota bacterium]|nr:hypothetical protein LBMAG53_10380 [Planctomycetota bacterium]